MSYIDMSGAVPIESLDALIAEHIMGGVKAKYSENLDLAWSVLKKCAAMRPVSRILNILPSPGTNYKIEISHLVQSSSKDSWHQKRIGHILCTEIAEAICVAALVSCGLQSALLEESEGFTREGLQ